jgi:hypothetical protein
MSPSCFGVESCPDGSVVIAAEREGELSVTRVEQGTGPSTGRSARPAKWALRSPDVSRQLHVWVMATVAADLVRTAGMAHEQRRRKR